MANCWINAPSGYARHLKPLLKATKKDDKKSDKKKMEEKSLHDEHLYFFLSLVHSTFIILNEALRHWQGMNG
jgi:hypothetical protein